MKTPAKRASALILCCGIVGVLLLTSSLEDRVVLGSKPASSDTQLFLGGYRTVEGMLASLDGQVAAQPGLVEKVVFGQSWCKAHAGRCLQPAVSDGYDLVAFHITNRNLPGPKPVFWFDAGLHPDEIVPPEIALRFISWLLDGYESNADARWLVDYQDIWVVPMANPDGHHIVEAGGDQPYLQRKNADTGGCSAFQPNGDHTFGVDLNRNFPFKWGTGDVALNDPCSQLYRGPSAGSENETQAIMSKLRSLIPDQRGPGDNDPAPLTASGIVQSMHSFAKVNFYPWNYSTDPAPNRADLDNIVAHMSASEAGGNGYKHCQSGALRCLGGADGNSMDWVYGELGAASITTELEGDGFTPHYPQVDLVWNNNKQALIYMAKIARSPYLTTRGPDANNVSIQPPVVDAGSRPRLSATIRYFVEGDDYLQNIGGAEYCVDTPPWAGGAPHALSPVDGSFSSAAEPVEASIDTSELSVGPHILFVRGRGVQTYEGSQSWGPVSALFIEVVRSGGTPVPSATPTTLPTVAAGARTPLSPPVTLPGSGSRLFPETGKTVGGIFLDYWNKNGGLAQQGYPISPVMGEVSDLDSKPYTVQYFERAVFEYHPENVGTPYEVLLSQLGTFRYRAQYSQPGSPLR